jgi:serine/threonine-protein kinase
VVERCPNDAFALVLLSDYERAGGDPMLGRTVVGRFTVVSRIGAGSMGSVYRAWQEAVGRPVALKIMRWDRASDPESRARFEREARAMSQLVSPNTVTIYDFGQAQDGSVYLAMELLEGESLGARLRRTPRLPLVDAVHIAREALVSLAEAHDKGIIHRDLKPDNLFLARLPDAAGPGQRELCKLLDFGIAKVVREERAIDALETQAGTVFGTPRYMSPEQAQGKPLDPRSDLYALGVILYQMVTGRAPFDDEDAVVVMARHIKTVPKLPRDVAPDVPIPSSLQRVIMRALSKNPRDRPPAAETFIRALDLVADRDLPGVVDSGAAGAVLSGEVILVDDDDPLPTTASKARRRKWIAAISAASVAVVGLGVAGVLLVRRPSSETAPGKSAQTPFPTLAASAPASAPSASGSAPAVPEAVVAIERLPVVGYASAQPASTPAGPKPPVAPVAPVRGPPAGKAAEPQGPPPAPPPATTKKTYERFE